MFIKNISSINPSKTVNYSSFINYIDTSSVTDGRLYQVQFLNESIPSRAKREVHKNDILISSVRPNLLHNYFVKEQINNCIASTGFIHIRITDLNYNPRYIYYFLTSKYNISLYTSIADSSQTTYPSFNKDVIANLKLPIISYENQLSIVDIMYC